MTPQLILTQAWTIIYNHGFTPDHLEVYPDKGPYCLLGACHRAVGWNESIVPVIKLIEAYLLEMNCSIQKCIKMPGRTKQHVLDLIEFVMETNGWMVPEK